MRKDVIDADFEVISGPSPVQWVEPRKPRDPWFKVAYAVLIGGLAAFVALMGLAGADLDTRDAVKASLASQDASSVALEAE